MSESGDYDPGPWAGHDFKSAKATYDRHVSRSYDDAKTNKVDPKSCIPESISTNSESPLVIACDVTGSMGQWPAVIFSKLPYLEIEGKEYLGEDMEISFAAIGDAHSDQYPLQVRPFSKGLELKDELAKLIIEGNGGGQIKESYELAGLYYARNVVMPKAIRPIFIMIGDEGHYDFCLNEQTETWAKTTNSKKTSVKAVFEELKEKYAVYLVRKPYSSDNVDSLSGVDVAIQAQWEEVLGADHVVILPGADRVVDVIFGILARETNRLDYFDDEITGRQKPAQVKVVMKSLHSVRQGPSSKKKLPAPGKSVTRRSKSSKASDTKSLI